MTKAEIKKMEQEQSALRVSRMNFVEAIGHYWRDVDAAEVYLKTKGEKLTLEEKERLFHRYEALNDYKVEYEKGTANSRMWSAIHCIVNSCGDRAYDISKELNVSLDRDDAFIDEIIWDTDNLKCILKQLRKFGFKRLFYLDNSTAAMRVISDLVMFGATFEGQVVNVKFDNCGVIVNIENVDLEDKLLTDSDMEYIEEELKKLGEDIKWSFDSEKYLIKIYKHFSTKYDYCDIKKAVDLIKHNIIASM